MIERIKTRSRRGLVALLVGFAAALALAACGSSSSSSSSTSTNSSSTGLSTASSDPNATLIVNASLPPETLDPTESGQDLEIGWIGTMYSTLTQVTYASGPIAGVNQQILSPTAVKPYVAESWTFTNGHKTLTFHLRPNLKFPSGDPLDAQAVKFSLERSIKVGSAGDSVMQETQYKPPLFEKIDTPNPTTVVIHYSRSAQNQPGDLAVPEDPIYDPKLVEEHGGVHEDKVNTWLASHSAGYGPYIMKSYSPGKQLVLEANPNFFEPPKTKHVIINFIPDNETLLLDAKSGAADVTIGMSLQAAKSLVHDPCCTVVVGKSRRSMWVNIPKFGKVPVFDNQKSREALAYATPYEGILKKVALGYGENYFGEWMPSYSWYDAHVGKPHEYNLEKAKQLMKESGIKTPLNITINTEIGDILGQEVATAVSGAWSEIGVNAKVVPVPLAQIFEIQKKYESASVELEGPLVTAPAYMWAYDLECEPKNPDGTSICLPEADKKMEEVEYGKFIGEPEKEQQALNEADEMYIKAVGKIWIFNSKFVTVLGKNVTHYDSTEIPDVRFWTKQ